MKRLSSILLFASFILIGCVKYNTYEIRLDDDERDLNNKNLKEINQIPLKDTFTFIFAGDAQRYYDEAIPLVENINGDESIDFVIFAGDFTDFGLAQEFQGMNSIIKGLKVPYLVVIGNHDLIYNGGEVYKQMFGEYDFSFDFHDFKFVFANTNGREFGFNGDVPDITWLNQQLDDTANYFGAIVVVHVPAGNDDFDNELEQDFVDALSFPKKTIMELNGHNHDHATDYPYYGDVHYITSYSLKKRKYLKIKIWKGDTPDSSHRFNEVIF